MPSPTRYLPVLLVSALAACSTSESSASADAPTRPFHHWGSAPVIAPSVPAYHPVPLPTYGRITGFVNFTGPAPVDSITHVTADADVCGATLVDISIKTRGQRVAGVVVWLTGVTAGKAMPYTRRFDLMTQGCRLVPRVQTAVVGGTVNVRNADAATHRTSFTRNGTVLVTVPETEDGQIVPTESVLTAAGLIEVGCVTHPWTHGWIAAFDQPYFAMTNDDGQFSIDSIPPGRYRVTAWHERFGVIADSVTVQGGVTSALSLTYRPKPRP
jgi:Polysaccharide lyase family 4, domain II